MEKNCLSCGVIFSKPANKSRKIWEERRYCSVKCARKVAPWNKGLKYDDALKSRLDLSGLEKGRGLFKGKQRPEISGELHPGWKEKTFKKCKGCDKELTLAPWESKRLFCDVTCYGLWHRGKNSPVYKGEEAKQKLRNRIMQLPEYVAWRKAIFLRDDFTCQICGVRGAHLHADHHPEPFWVIRDRNVIMTVEQARGCKEFWEIKRGRTLCRECHRKTDSYMRKPSKPNRKR